MSEPPSPSAGALLAQREAAVGGARRAVSEIGARRLGPAAPRPTSEPRPGDLRAAPAGAPAGASGRPVTVAGQAVAGGVLMRGEGAWAVAVRAGDGIRVSRFALPPARRPRVLGWPVLRGVAAAADALALGLKGHALSAGPRVSARLAAAFAAGLLVLFAAPALAAAALLPPVPAALLEGPLRIALLVGALALAARRPRLHRLLAYHGAEHKAVGCHEAGAELSPEAARLLPRVHARCGTGFLLAVTLVAAVVFVPLAGLAPPLQAATRIAAIPLVAGLAFELFRAAVRRPGRPWARAVLRPGMRLQRLTTREPDAAQLAVAVAALRAVLPQSSDERRA